MANRIAIDEAKKILRAFFKDEWFFTIDNFGSYEIKLNGETIHLFLVGQTQSYGVESERGHLFSPMVGYPKMREVEPKDIIFSCQGAMIKSINVALESAEETAGTVDGLRIDCLYSELSIPLDIVPLRPRLAGHSPFARVTGYLPRAGYIHYLHPYAARLLLDEIKESGNRPR